MIQILQRQHEQTGRSYRQLTSQYGLSRSRLLRWQANVRRGRPAIRPPGRRHRPLPALLLVVVYLHVAGLRHGPWRSRGFPALCRAWAPLVCRATMRQFASSCRQRLRLEERARLQRVRWLHVGSVWAMDEAVIRGLRWLLVTDLASRFRFRLLLADDLPARRVVAHLVALFRCYTPPLVIKRDNGSNLANREVDAFLAGHDVITLTSPCYWPRYNGGAECAQREIKAVAVLLATFAGVPLHRALARAPDILNARPRPCLHGATADEVFHSPSTVLRRAFTSTGRKETRHWIDQHTDAILSTMTVRNRHAQAAARRLATETRMLDMGLIALVQPPAVSPHFP